MRFSFPPKVDFLFTRNENRILFLHEWSVVVLSTFATENFRIILYSFASFMYIFCDNIWWQKLNLPPSKTMWIHCIGRFNLTLNYRLRVIYQYFYLCHWVYVTMFQPSRYELTHHQISFLLVICIVCPASSYGFWLPRVVSSIT